MALKYSVLSQTAFTPGTKKFYIAHENRAKRIPMKVLAESNKHPFSGVSSCVGPCTYRSFSISRYGKDVKSFDRVRSKGVGRDSDYSSGKDAVSKENLNFISELVKRGIIIAATVCGILVFGYRRVFGIDGVANAAYGVLGQSMLLFRNVWPKMLPAHMTWKEQGLVLSVLMGLSAFFSMADTSITALWPWKLRALAEKEPENGVFRLLRNNITRILTTILIGTTVVQVGATVLVTKAAIARFGDAGIYTATGVMTAYILLLTEIIPRSIAVHSYTEVARFVARPVAWLSVVLYPIGIVAIFLSAGLLKLLGLERKSKLYVTEEEFKFMVRGPELSHAIEEKEQDMIENVLEIKDARIREVMTPLEDVVAIDASARLNHFHHLWVTHQYSRVPVYEQRRDNIVGIAYAKDLLDHAQKTLKGEQLESTVGDLAHKPAYFVPDSMSVSKLLREFQNRKVRMAVVLNEYGGTVGIVTPEDVFKEIVGEIFHENDPKEQTHKKTGHIVMQAEGIFDVDADTSIDQLSEELSIKMPEGHQYETVSGFVCEKFGHIPKTGESIKVVFKEDKDDNEDELIGDQKDIKANYLIFKLEILAGNARKVSSVRFEQMLEIKEASPWVPKQIEKNFSDEHS